MTTWTVIDDSQTSSWAPINNNETKWENNSLQIVAWQNNSNTIVTWYYYS